MEFTDEDNVAFSEWLSRHGGSFHDRYDKVDGEVSGKTNYCLAPVLFCYDNIVVSCFQINSMNLIRRKEQVRLASKPVTKSFLQFCSYFNQWFFTITDLLILLLTVIYQ